MRFIGIVLWMCAVVGLGAQGSDRGALVIGNSAYQANPLVNPVNDAQDVAQALRGLGFDVILKTDGDLNEMEKALKEFQGKLQGKSTALFYYAGHGVQVEGENYLIPVRVDIRSAVDARTRGLSMSKVLESIKASGVQTGLVFLDACRDNPFPGASRSGARGLSVIPAPADLETLIAFATSPGDTAADGTGRNGVFTGAFLKHLGKPGTPISELMTSVKAEVKAVTGGRQQPRVDDGLSKPFIFADPGLLAQRTKQDADKAQAELAALDRQIADRQAAIQSARNASERQKLEVEQQKQQALANAKRLEAENLAKEAEKRRIEAENLRKTELSKTSQLEAEKARQAELADLAAKRRAEAEKVRTDGDNPDLLIESIEMFDQSINEIVNQFSNGWIKTRAEINKTYDAKLSALNQEKDDGFESPAEFAQRIRLAKENLEKERNQTLIAKAEETKATLKNQTEELVGKMRLALKNLQSKSWMLTGSAVQVQAGTFDKDTKRWPFFIKSSAPELPYETQIVLDLNQGKDPRQFFKDLETAIKAQALSAEISYGIVRDNEGKKYFTKVLDVKLKDLGTGRIVHTQNIQANAAWFTPGARTSARAFAGVLKMTTPKDPAEIFLNGQFTGKTPFSINLLVGDYSVEYRWPNGKSESKQIKVIPEKKIDLDLSYYMIGDRGPAGGYIFFDKGKFSDGWRYLESSLEDFKVKWDLNENGAIAPNGQGIGDGPGNALAIIKAQISKVDLDYGAKVCAKYQFGGYDDWWMPSKDELDLMYRNLHQKGLGLFSPDFYWNSSLNPKYSDSALLQNFKDGRMSQAPRHTFHLVRPIRAF